MPDAIPFTGLWILLGENSDPDGHPARRVFELVLQETRFSRDLRAVIGQQTR